MVGEGARGAIREASEHRGRMLLLCRNVFQKKELRRSWRACIFPRMRRATLRGDAILLVTAVLWGGAFVAQRAAMRHMGPMTFNAVRFAIGAALLVPIMAVLARRRAAGQECADAPADREWRLHVYGGVTAGLVMFVAAGLQQAGLVYTTAGKAGFITGLYVPLVPIFGLAVGQRTGAATWAGATLAVVGLYLLSVTGPLTIGAGDGLVIACAAVWAVHVLLIGALAPRLDPLQLGFVQFATVAIASLLAAVFTERVSTQAFGPAVWAILYGGFVSVGIAFTLQLVGQRDAPPGHAALVLSLEAVFAAVAGYLLLDERFGVRELCGAVVMLGGMLVSQANRLRSARA